MPSATIACQATPSRLKGAPHGMCTTEKDKVNQGLLTFIQRKEAQRVFNALM